MSKANTQQAGPFEALLGELTTLAKALPVDGGDAAIAAAASDAGGKGGKKAGGETVGEKGEDDEELDADGKPIMKSMSVVIDGKTVDALDGTELIKSLMGDVEKIGKKIDESESVIAKALETTIAIITSQAKTIEKQGVMLKALQEGVTEIGGEGRGRRTLLAIAEKPSVLAKSETQGMTGAEFMVKANSAFDKKMISGKDLTVIDVALRQQQEIDPALIQKVLSATS